MHTIANLSKRQMAYVTAITTYAPTLGIDINKKEFSRAELRQVSMHVKGKRWIPNWITHDQSRRAARGVFLIPEVMESMAVTPGEETEGDGLDDSTPMVTETTEEMELITA
jgi:hypothetical protein